MVASRVKTGLTEDMQTGQYSDTDSWSDSFFSACLATFIYVALDDEGFMLLSAILLLMCGFCHKACNVTYTAIHCVMLCHLVNSTLIQS